MCCCNHRCLLSVLSYLILTLCYSYILSVFWNRLQTYYVMDLGHVQIKYLIHQLQCLLFHSMSHSVSKFLIFQEFRPPIPVEFNVPCRPRWFSRTFFSLECTTDTRCHGGDPHIPYRIAQVYKSPREGGGMDQISIKTTNSKCRLYWCLIEFIDWRYS